jgi:hypothetical protein
MRLCDEVAELSSKKVTRRRGNAQSEKIALEKHEGRQVPAFVPDDARDWVGG